MAPRLLHAPGMMDFIQPGDDVTLQVAADEFRSTASAQLFIMPARTDDRVIPLVARRRKDNVVAMPLRGRYPSYQGPALQYPGNALEYWPRGYPAHDDL